MLFSEPSIRNMWIPSSHKTSRLTYPKFYCSSKNTNFIDNSTPTHKHLSSVTIFTKVQIQLYVSTKIQNSIVPRNTLSKSSPDTYTHIRNTIAPFNTPNFLEFIPLPTQTHIYKYRIALHLLIPQLLKLIEMNWKYET